MMFSKANYIKSKKQKVNQKRQTKDIEKLQNYYNSSPIKKSNEKVIVDLSSDSEESAQLIQIAPQNYKKKPIVRQSKKQQMRDNYFDRNKEMQEKKPFNNSGKTTTTSIQNDSNNKPVKNNNQTRHNNFNFDKIKKYTSSMRQSVKPAILGVQVQIAGIQESISENTKPINYKRQGVSKQNTISQKYLKTRLQKFQQQLESASVNNINAQINQKQQGKIQQSQENQVQVEQKKFKRPPRYFDEQIAEVSDQKDSENEEDEDQKRKVIKCYRCGQKGHIARLCYQKQTLKCVFCLGPHHSSDCTDKLCHRCNQKGHIKQQCKSEKIQCRKCRMYGHIGKHCGKVLMMNFKLEKQKQIRENYDKLDLEKLKCLKCNGHKDSKGHFNCHQYSKRIPRIYDSTYIVL